MLNLDLVDGLYEGLTKERQQQLISKLFSKSKQTMAYFHRTKDISMSKLEILADFFHLPMDYFRADADVKLNNFTGGENYFAMGSNICINTNLMKENMSLRNEIKRLEDLVAAKDAAMATQQSALATKDAFIACLQGLMPKKD